ncbi:hypothetical protein RJ641_018889 [Dillenia turbinata]|uniref:Uncharacterized protein n=1 Tax=Dillenia turbinata TaxID=194707 RepID=A0AAN8UFY6_9MAGN
MLGAMGALSSSQDGTGVPVRQASPDGNQGFFNQDDEDDDSDSGGDEDGVSQVSPHRSKVLLEHSVRQLRLADGDRRR